MQKASSEAEQRASELAGLQRQFDSLQRTYEAALKEIDALHMGRTSAAKRAEEALAELALVRETQQALTTQVAYLTGVINLLADSLREGLGEG